MDMALSLIGRERGLFAGDVRRAEPELSALVQAGSFLVIGGAGSVGQAVVKEIFQRNPKRLHAVDVSENNLVEVVRDLRSSIGYIEGDFRTLALDCGSPEFEAFCLAQEPYDYILNLSALKHVRSEKDPYTLMRMISVNILNTEKTLQYAVEANCRKYFGVSSDKAVRPASAMGATKNTMEMCLMRASQRIPVSTARFANVAFSNGSLLHGFTERLKKRQPLSAPQDVRRYFITTQEAGVLCLMSCLLGESRDTLFPKPCGDLPLIDFRTLAERYLQSLGYEPCACASEDEARSRVEELVPAKRWPCYFFDSDTTGEKPFEEFYTEEETVDLDRFETIGVVQNPPFQDEAALDEFLATIAELRRARRWTREDLLAALHRLLPGFAHIETHKFLNGRM